MTRDEFRDWMDRLCIDERSAAEALGVRVRQIERYLAGTTRVKQSIAMACALVERQRDDLRGVSDEELARMAGQHSE